MVISYHVVSDCIYVVILSIRIVVVLGMVVSRCCIIVIILRSRRRLIVLSRRINAVVIDSV